MALWDTLKSRFADMTGQAKTQVSKYKSKDLANASMAMCALIAAADGTIDPQERAATEGFIRSNEALKAFDTQELIDKFNWYASKLEKDFNFGQLEANATIRKLKDKPEARTVITVGILIGGADGHFDEHEKKAVRTACHELGIPPAEYDL